MRLKRRAEDPDAVIETRLQNARIEIEHWRDYDYVVINDDLDRAFAEVKSIVTAERLRRDRRPGLFDFVSGLLTSSAASLSRSDQAACQPDEFLDSQRFGAPGAVDSCSFEQRFAAERFQALPQHFSPLTERGFGHAAEHLTSAASGVARGHQMNHR